MRRYLNGFSSKRFDWTSCLCEGWTILDNCAKCNLNCAGFNQCNKCYSFESALSIGRNIERHNIRCGPNCEKHFQFKWKSATLQSETKNAEQCTNQVENWNVNTLNDRFEHCVDIFVRLIARANATFHQNKKLQRDERYQNCKYDLLISKVLLKFFEHLLLWCNSFDSFTFSILVMKCLWMFFLVLWKLIAIHALAIKERFFLFYLLHVVAACSEPDFVELCVNKLIFAPCTIDLFTHTCAVLDQQNSRCQWNSSSI